MLKCGVLCTVNKTPGLWQVHMPTEVAHLCLPGFRFRRGAPLLVRIHVTPFMPQPTGTVPLKLLLPRSRNQRCGIVPFTAQLMRQPSTVMSAHVSTHTHTAFTALAAGQKAPKTGCWKVSASHVAGRLPERWLLNSCSLIMFEKDPLAPQELGIEPVWQRG